MVKTAIEPIHRPYKIQDGRQFSQAIFMKVEQIVVIRAWVRGRIVPVHAKPAGFTAVRWSQGSTPRKYSAHDTYSSNFLVHTLHQTELTKEGRSKWRLWPLRQAISCTRDGADWPKVAAIGAQQPISYFFGFLQMRDALSANGEHLRVAEVKSFPVIPKSMRSVNGDRNGANFKKWSVLLVCTIAAGSILGEVLFLRFLALFFVQISCLLNVSV